MISRRSFLNSFCPPLPTPPPPPPPKPSKSTPQKENRLEPKMLLMYINKVNDDILELHGQPVMNSKGKEYTSFSQ